MPKARKSLLLGTMWCRYSIPAYHSPLECKGERRALGWERVEAEVVEPGVVEPEVVE